MRYATAFDEDLATRDAIENKIKLRLAYLMGVKIMRVTELLTKDTIAMDLMANDKMVLLMS